MKRISRPTTDSPTRGLEVRTGFPVLRGITIGLATGMVLFASLSAAGLELAVGTAEAAWPGCPEDHPAGPCHWCPGDPPVQTGNLRTDPVRWDATICHTYYYDYPYGNVAKTIWDGDDPPAAPPPSPGLYCDPGTFFGHCRIGTHP